MKFIIETSASTGSFKQVIVDERAYLMMAEVDCADLDITDKAIVAMDRGGTAGWLNYYRAKISGAQLAIYPGSEKASMRQWINQQGITHLNTLATTFRWLAAGIYKFPAVECLEIGGEMVDWADADLARVVFPNAVLFNRYAASEARIICRKRVGSNETGQGRMPVGQPVKGVSVAIDNATKEIWVSSPYLSEGYYNDPELTAAKFRDGWYHTGDLGKWLPNGELMHGGRMDFGELLESVASESTRDERLAKWTLAGG